MSVQNFSTIAHRDELFNVRFVKVVEKYPLLYNHTLADYSNRELQDRAWQKVATEVQDFASDCKERWKNIRGCLTRHLKQITRGCNKKPYYLAEHMKFLIPFTKSRNDMRPYKLLNPEEFDFDMVEEVIKTEGDLSTLHERYSQQVEELPVQNLVSLSPPHVQLKREIAVDPGEPSPSLGTKQKRLKPNDTDDKDETDSLFFKTILPSVASMNPRQKSKFRLGVLKLLDDLLFDTEMLNNS